MLSYFFKRLLMIIPTLLCVSVTVFIVMRLVPGDPILLIMGDIKNPELIAQMREQLGLDQPLLVQYSHWLGQLLQLDFGKSIVTGGPVLSTMLDSFAVTVQIVLISVAIAAVIAVLGGTIAAWQKDRLADKTIVGVAILCMSIPSFWLGIALILIFGVELQWLPTVGYISPWQDMSEGIKFLLLPIITLVLAEMGSILRMVRSATLDNLQLEYISHARAKGLGEMTILFRHAMKNSFTPTLTLIGLVMGGLLGGAAVIETVFTLPGLGRLLISSINNRDYMMVQGIMILVASCYVLINLLIDMLYPLIDPRVKL